MANWKRLLQETNRRI